MRPPRSNNITISSRVRSVTARKSRLAMDSWEASQNDRLRLLILRAGESQDKPAGRESGSGEVWAQAGPRRADGTTLFLQGVAAGVPVLDALSEPPACLVPV